MPFDADDDAIWGHVPTVVKTTTTKKSYDHHFARYFYSVLGDIATNGYMFTLFDHRGIVGREGEEVWGYLQLLRWLRPTTGASLTSTGDQDLQPSDKAAQPYMHQIVWRDSVTMWGVDVHPASHFVSPIFQLANVTEDAGLDDVFGAQGTFNNNRMTTTAGMRYMVLGDTPRAQKVDLLFWTIAVSFPADHYGVNPSNPVAGALALERAANQTRYWRLHSGFKWRLKTSGALVMQDGTDDSLSEEDRAVILRTVATYIQRRPG